MSIYPWLCRYRTNCSTRHDTPLANLPYLSPLSPLDLPPPPPSLSLSLCIDPSFGVFPSLFSFIFYSSLGFPWAHFRNSFFTTLFSSTPGSSFLVATRLKRPAYAYDSLGKCGCTLTPGFSVLLERFRKIRFEPWNAMASRSSSRVKSTCRWIYLVGPAVSLCVAMFKYKVQPSKSWKLLQIVSLSWSMILQWINRRDKTFVHKAAANLLKISIAEIYVLVVDLLSALSLTLL